MVTARSATPGLPGERAGTVSAGPCGPGRRERSDRSRGPSRGHVVIDGTLCAVRGESRRRPRRRAGRACSARLRRVEATRVPSGRNGVPTGLITAVATRGPGAQRTEHVTRRRGSYRSAASPRAARAGAAAGGAVATGRSRVPAAQEEARVVTDRRSPRRRAGARRAAGSTPIMVPCRQTSK